MQTDTIIEFEIITKLYTYQIYIYIYIHCNYEWMEEKYKGK